MVITDEKPIKATAYMPYGDINFMWDKRRSA